MTFVSLPMPPGLPTVPARAAVRVAPLLVSALALAACGADGSAAPDAGGSGAASSPPSAGPVEGRGTVTENADGTRTVVSSWGTTVVPADPQRVVSVVGDIDLDALVALDVAVVGAGTQGGTEDDGFAPHLLGPELEDAAPLSWGDGVPYEAVAALEPDLVLAPDQESYELLSQIAPTVPRGSWVASQWKDDLRYVAEVVGRRERADELIAAHEERAADLAEQVDEVLGEDVVVASPQVSYDSSGVYVDPSDAFSSVVLDELGMQLHPLAAGATGEGVSVSFERLPEIDADVLFWQVRQADDGSADTAALGLATGSPLWGRVPAVQQDRVVEVVNRPWYFPGITAAGVVLDDVEAALDDLG